MGNDSKAYSMHKKIENDWDSVDSVIMANELKNEPRIEIERDYPTEKHYFMLKDYLRFHKFNLAGDVSFWYDTLEFVVEESVDCKTATVLDIKKSLEKDNLIVVVIGERDFKRKAAFSPILKDKACYDSDKVYFFIRVALDSEFFEREHPFVFDDEENDETSELIELDEEELIPSPEEEQKAQPKTLDKKIFFIGAALCYLLMLGIIVFFVLFPSQKSKNRKEVSSLDFEAEKIRVYYDLVFETSMGVKKFYNADYQAKGLKIYVTSYGPDFSIIQYDEFSRWSVKNISKTVRY